MRTLICLACFLFSVLASAQDYAADIRNALTVYASPQLQIDSKVDIYPSYSATQPTQSLHGTIKKSGANYYSEMADVRLLLNDKYQVMIYKDEKQIVCRERDKKSVKLLKQSGDPASSIDSLLKKNDSIVYKGLHDGLKTYIVYTGKSMIRRTEIYLDTKNGYIQQLVYYYNEQLVPLANKVRIQYTVNTSPSFSANEFSEKRFLNFSRNSVAAAGECAGYEVIFLDKENNEPSAK